MNSINELIVAGLVQKPTRQMEETASRGTGADPTPPDALFGHGRRRRRYRRRRPQLLKKKKAKKKKNHDQHAIITSCTYI